VLWHELRNTGSAYDMGRFGCGTEEGELLSELVGEQAPRRAESHGLLEAVGALGEAPITSSSFLFCLNRVHAENRLPALRATRLPIAYRLNPNPM
jgi:hypothetical protein